MPTRLAYDIRVAIVQYDALERDLLRVALGGSSGIEVVGAYPDGEELLRDAATIAPGVVVLDIDPTGHNGVPLALRLRRALPDLGIVMLVGDRDGDLLGSLPGHGLDQWSYLVNRAKSGLTTLLRAIQVTHARLLDLGDIESPRSARPKPPPRLPELTRRQTEVVALLTLGLTNRAIADALQVKEKTIENQLSVIYQKLDPGADRTRVHARVWAALRFGRSTRGGAVPGE